MSGPNDAVKPLTVKSAGVNVSSLVRDVICTQRPLQGVMLGSTVTRRFSKVTDFGTTEAEETVVDIQSFLHDGETLALFDAHGDVDVAAVDRLIGRKRKSIVGWFSFRHGSPLRPSMRELAAHASFERLRASAAGTGDQGPLILALFNTTATRSTHTHTHDHRLLARLAPGLPMEAVPLVLQSYANKADAEYYEFRAQSELPVWEQSSSIIQSALDATHVDTCGPIEQFLDGVIVQLEKASDDLAQSERDVAAAEARIAQLRVNAAAAAAPSVS